MNSKNTYVWFVVAALLFASIYCYERYLRPVPVPIRNILSDLQPAAVTSIHVIPAGALEIRADRTNGSWLLSKPVSYPAQPAAIETLLAALQKLAPALRINASELHEHSTADADYGFDSPQDSVVVEAGDERWQLLVGNKTAPGDQVYLRVVGVDGAFVTDAGWLKFLPHSANDWRSTTLVDAGENSFDSILLTNGIKSAAGQPLVIELRRNATNHLWRMIRPLQARANSDRITEALQQLHAARAKQFVTDDPNADLTAFGLQPADLDLWLGHGTNFTAAIHTSKSLTNDPSQIYAKREGWNAIVTTPKENFAPWHGTVNDWRDPRLLELTAPVAEIDVLGETNFTLQRQGSNDWTIVGEKFPADADSVGQFIKILADMRIADFAKNVVTAPDLPAYGLATPLHQITLRSAIGDSNAVIAQLSFGTNQDSEVFVRRADEDFIYAVTTEDFKNVKALYGQDWEFRDRQIWKFTENDVTQITLQENGKTRTIVRDGANQWSPAPGSQGWQGIVKNPPAIEETVHRLGELTALYWIGRNITDPEKNYGLDTNNLAITIDLKSGEKLSVAFGTELPAAHTALAAVTLDGERWAFVFPPVLYQFVVTYLAIPANVP